MKNRIQDPMGNLADTTAGGILVVDDTKTIRARISGVLRRAGYDVEEAVDGEQGLERLVGGGFDAVLLDIMMPGIDGFEVCTKIRAMARGKLLPILLISSLEEPDVVVRAMNAGATDFLRKPIRDGELLARIASSVAHKRLTDRLDDTEAVLFALARMVEAKDRTTGDHCDRLAHMAVVFGRALGLPHRDLEALRRGGVLHDIGKLGIPDAILLKQGPLTDGEWEIMREHTTIGAHLCEPLNSMQDTVEIVRSHHEKWDGSGYPDGLLGEAIPQLARVFQIVDVWDALCSERPYKKAFEPAKAAEILHDEMVRGRWDPELVIPFLELAKSESSMLHLPSGAEHVDRSKEIYSLISRTGVRAQTDAVDAEA